MGIGTVPEIENRTGLERRRGTGGVAAVVTGRKTGRTLAGAAAGAIAAGAGVLVRVWFVCRLASRCRWCAQLLSFLAQLIVGHGWAAVRQAAAVAL
jgi:hypothetical protein